VKTTFSSDTAGQRRMDRHIIEAIQYFSVTRQIPDIPDLKKKDLVMFVR